LKYPTLGLFEEVPHPAVQENAWERPIQGIREDGFKY
jgi:hypothetical protein